NAPTGVAGLGVGQQAQDGVGGHRLSRTALADQRQGLPGLDIEAHATYCQGFLALGAEGHTEVVDPYQWLGHVISSGRRHRVELHRIMPAATYTPTARRKE